MRRLIVLFSILSFAFAVTHAQEYTITSPGGKAKMVVHVNQLKGISATCYYLDKEMSTLGPISLQTVDGKNFGISPKVKKVNHTSVNQMIVTPVAEKRKQIPDHYNEIEIVFKDPFSVIFRAYDDGVAYRIKTTVKGEMTVKSEQAAFTFPANDHLFIPTDKSMYTHSERAYQYLTLSQIGKDTLSSVPFMIDRQDGIKVLVTEADLEDYPGLYVYGTNGNTLKVKFPPYVLKDPLIGDRDRKPVEVAGYIAKTTGTRTFPWRVVAFAAEDKDVIGNDIVYRLAAPCRLTDTSWIKPGKVAWDWWNANNNEGVAFRSGINTETYKFYIDFAAQYKLEYIILDEGWSKPSDLFAINPDVDMPALCKYAQSKGVDVILWCLWNALDKDLDKALDQFKQWGVKGVKVDFMQRDDQAMVNYYWKVSKAAADRHLLVDFHGAYKPCGLERTYPNMLTREGVKGLENCKWGAEVTPDHDCTLPFIRMFAGPMDYTPGAMRNSEKKNFDANYTRPMSQGTRCHQLGLYVVFESPLQMLADAPCNYLKEKECMEFLSAVPSVWDETKPLAGKVGDYVAVARQKGKNWFVGAITDWTPRELDVTLDFLPAGTYKLIEFVDGINADQLAEDYARKETLVKAGDHIKIKMAPGGGYAAMIEAK